MPTRPGLKALIPGAAAYFDCRPGVSEMDALIAYLQVLGTMVDFSTFEPDPETLRSRHGYVFIPARTGR